MAEGRPLIRRQKNQPSEGSMLYRYVTIDKLIDFLINARLSFTRLNLFEDKLEGITPEHLALNIVSDRIAKKLSAEWLGDLADVVTFNMNPTSRNERSRYRKVFQRTNYANCWYINDHESVAMWQLYSRRDSVAIRIPFAALAKEIDSGDFDSSSSRIKTLNYGGVQYIRFNEADVLTEFIVNEEAQGFVKDESYSHEREFRIMLTMEDNEVKKAEPKKFVLDEQVEEMNARLDIRSVNLRFRNFSSMPFEIVFHPQCSEWHRSNISTIIRKLDLGFTAKESALKRMFRD